MFIPIDKDVKQRLLSRKKFGKIFAQIVIGFPGNHAQQTRIMDIRLRQNNRIYDKEKKCWLYEHDFIYPNKE